MFRPTPAVLEALRPLVDADELDAALATRRPDLTNLLLTAARDRDDLPRPLLGATVRAGCARLGELHPGRSVELRVPPFAAVQLGFGSGPTHTRGTPPNVVEMAPDVFVPLAVGKLAYDDAAVSTSGAHAHEVRAVFPLTWS